MSGRLCVLVAHLSQSESLSALPGQKCAEDYVARSSLKPDLLQAKRQRLFFLFQKYDEDDSGSLDAGRFPLAHVYCAQRYAPDP